MRSVISMVVVLGCSGGPAGRDDADPTDSGTEPAPGGFVSVADATDCPSCLSHTALAVDDAGHAWVAWVDWTAAEAVVRVARSEDDWASPVQVGVATEPSGAYNRQVAMDVDPDGSLLAVAWSEAWFDGDTHVSLSTDGGVTFADEILIRAGDPRQLAVEVRDGRVAVAIHDGLARTGGEIFVRDGTSGPWTTTDFPVLDVGGELTTVTTAGVGLALRPADLQPFVALGMQPVSTDPGYDTRVVVWGADEAEPTVVADSDGVQNDWADLDLDFDGDELWTTMILIDDRAASPLRLVHRDAAGVWGAPARVPSDVDDSYDWSVDTSVRDGRVSAIVEIGGGGDEVGCGSPKLVTTTDGASFDPCGLTGGVDGASAGYVEVDEDANGRRRVAFVAAGPYGDLPAGVVVWSE